MSLALGERAAREGSKGPEPAEKVNFKTVQLASGASATCFKSGVGVGVVHIYICVCGVVGGGEGGS